MNSSRLVGVMLISLGVLVGVIAGVWLLVNADLSGPARVLGLGLILIVAVAPLVGGGIYMVAFGGKEATAQAEAKRQRQLLNIVLTRGEVAINDVAVEMQLSRDQIKDMLHTLVGLGVFSGYINWEKGTLYSSEASRLRDLKQCPNCSGEITLSGKGVAHCRFCGTEFFLS